MSQQGLHFSKKISKLKIFFDLTFTDVHMGHQKVPKFDFQSHFSMSKNVRLMCLDKVFFFYKQMNSVRKKKLDNISHH